MDAHELAQISRRHWKAGEIDDAVRVGREALDLARAAADDGAEANAANALGSVLLDTFLAKGPDDPDWPVFEEAMELLERAALLYKAKGTVDYATTLLAMAAGWHTIDQREHADLLYKVVTTELEDDKWGATEELARYTDYLRGRAFLGHARIVVEDGLDEDVGHLLEVAVNLLMSGDPAVFPKDVEEAASLFETLGEPEEAEAVREALREHLAEVAAPAPTTET